MVDSEIVMEKLIRGAAVGAGSFASGFVGEQINEFSDGLGDVTLGLAKVGIGVGVSVVAADDNLLIDLEANQGSIQSEAAEFAGYGMQGAGWSEVGRSLDIGFGGDRGRPASSKRTVRRKSRRKRKVRTDGSGSSSSGTGGSQHSQSDLLIDA